MRSRFLVITLAVAGCGREEPAHGPAGLAPEAAAQARPIQEAPVALERPAAAPAKPPAEAPAPAPAKGTIVFEVAPLGRFEVITWEAAARQAEQRIAAEQAPGELRRLRLDIQGRAR
jgi:hypothetical protein